MSISSEDEILEAFIRVSQAVTILLNGMNGNENDLDGIVYQVTKLYRLARLLTTTTEETLQAIGQSLTSFERMQYKLDCDVAYGPGLIATGSSGRPRLDVRKEQLEYLLDMGFTGPQIATTIGVSLSTVRRRMTEYGLSIKALYSDITDHQLDSVVEEIKVLFPNSGYRLVKGHLLSQGYRISQLRIRESLQRVDPEGIVIRWAATIERRRYRVRSPLSLWHFDGNHKLIRWRMVIHGCVDGYSRIPVYLHCSNNNRADTVLSLFKKAVEEYGLPSRVRCDQGGENVDVSMYLLNHPLRGPGRGTVLVGKSVHNQRAERLWRDVYEGVTGLYHSLFFYLENIGLLDPSNELHLFCLHYVFMPRINRHLRLWRSAWVKHPMRSERNMTPQMLWTAGLQNIAHSGSNIAKEVFEQLADDELETFGIDWDGPMPHPDDESICETVVVPEMEFPLDSYSLDELDEMVAPLADTTNYGIDLYEKVLDFVSSKLDIVL